LNIDTSTPCLINRQSGEVLETAIEKIVPQKGEFRGWKFKWTKPIKNGYDVYALRIKGEKEIQGLIATMFVSFDKAVYIDIVENAPHNIGKNGRYKGVGAHLFAFACKQAIENKVDYVAFTSKTRLIEYYKKELGASQIGSSQKMYITGDSFDKLINRYYGGTYNE
jgi:hypothetical protein